MPAEWLAQFCLVLGMAACRELKDLGTNIISSGFVEGQALPSEGHACTNFERGLMCFGGSNGANLYTTIWTFNPEEALFVAHAVGKEEQDLVTRHHHSIAALPSGKVLAFGGVSNGLDKTDIILISSKPDDRSTDLKQFTIVDLIVNWPTEGELYGAGSSIALDLDNRVYMFGNVKGKHHSMLYEATITGDSVNMTVALNKTLPFCSFSSLTYHLKKLYLFCQADSKRKTNGSFYAIDVKFKDLEILDNVPKGDLVGYYYDERRILFMIANAPKRRDGLLLRKRDNIALFDTLNYTWETDRLRRVPRLEGSSVVFDPRGFTIYGGSTKEGISKKYYRVHYDSE